MSITKQNLRTKVGLPGEQTFGQSISWPPKAGNRATRGNAKRIHTRTEGGAMPFPVWAHPLPGQTRLRWGWSKAAECETRSRKTVETRAAKDGLVKRAKTRPKLNSIKPINTARNTTIGAI